MNWLYSHMMLDEQKSSSEKKRIEVNPVTFKLTDKDIVRYKGLIKDFPLSKEDEILQKIPAKLKGIMTQKRYSSFIIDMISDVEQLYLVLADQKSLSDYNRRMILFALDYFVNDQDEIPDSIDMIGYLDDTVVVRWVVDEIKSEHPEYFRD